MMAQTIGGALILVALVSGFSGICGRVLGHPSERQSDHEISLEREKIFVKFEDGFTFSLMMEPDDTVQNLWGDISEYEGVPGCRTQLKFGDIKLAYGAKLSNYNIQAGSTVDLVMPEVDQGGRYTTTSFFVSTRDGRELPIASPLETTVASLKETIMQWIGVPRIEQRLLLNGKELKDERKLVQYNIDNGTTIDLGGSLEDCNQVVTIYVKTLSGATIEIEVNLADTVADLKEMIWRKAGVPTGVQRLHANERVITGQDHLCDLGLEAGSIVYMWLYSSRVTCGDQVARLKEPPVALPVNNYRAPILRELENVADHRPAASLYRDARNWVAQRDSGRRGWDPNLFDPAAYLAPDLDNEELMLDYHRTLEFLSRPDAMGEWDSLKAVMTRARIKLSSAVRPYRRSANLSSVSARSVPGITLGGGGPGDASPNQLVPLGADVDNWAPDALSDSDLMRLFEVAERVRQVLARATQTGEGLLGVDSQRRINNAILFTYAAALAGYLPSSVYDQPSEDEPCGICRDDLTAEPAIKLACGHAFHADCIHSWAINLYHQQNAPTCPFCRRRFMLPYEAVGRIELDTPELQCNQDESE